MLKSKFLILIIFLISITLIPSKVVFSSNYTELKVQIESKEEALKELEKQESIYLEELSKTKTNKSSLINELSRIRREIQGLNFKIKVNEAQLEKFSLELEKLEIESKTTEEKISLKKNVLASSLRDLYNLENNDNTLSVLISQSNLSDAMLEIENIIEFGENIEIELKNLKNLKKELNEQEKETKTKKRESEIAKSNLKNRKIISSELKEEKDGLLEITKNKEKNYQNILSDLDKQRAEIEAEISRIEEALKAQIDPNLLPKPRPGLLNWPTKGWLSQGYGVTKDSKTFYRQGSYKSPSHNGIDIASPTGNAVYSAEDGEVVATGNQDKYCYKGAYGKFVVISHNNNLTTLYAHLSLYSVKRGDMVKRGDIIGYIGNTGFSTGSHLHFTVYFTPTFRMTTSNFCGAMPAGGNVNPLGYLD
jgi:murein DD-endopeptidase MepM/ murein hydrolase activator NlpD